MKANDSYLKISVKDTGCGISEEDQGKLFKLFGFLKTTEKKNTKGIGLGLYISKRIVEFFGGGKIDLQSELGIGTTFTFKFKLGEDPNPVIQDNIQAPSLDNFSDASLKKTATIFDMENGMFKILNTEMGISDESEPQKNVNESNLNRNGYNSLQQPEIQSMRAIPEPRKSDNLSDVTVV